MPLRRAAEHRGNAPLYDDAQARSEKAILIGLLSVRGMHIAQGLVCTTTAWRSYRRPGLVAATLAFSTAESAWLVRHCWRRGAVDEQAPVLVDVAAGVVGLIALAAGTTAEDRTAWVNWMCPLTIGSAAVSALVFPRRQGVAVASVLSGTCLATVTSSLRSRDSSMATGLANSMSYFGFFAAADLVAGRMRRSAIELDAARREAVERGARLATERERNRQHQLLHDSALQTLEAVAKGWSGSDDDAMRARARHEAGRLRAALRGEPDGEERFGSALQGLADEFSVDGLNVEMMVAEVEVEPGAEASVVLCEVVREALDNVVRHAEVSRAVVRARSDDGHVEVTVRDHGVGFDTAGPAAGRGLPDRIMARLRDLGGTAEVESAPERGTLVRVRVPT